MADQVAGDVLEQIDIPLGRAAEIRWTDPLAKGILKAHLHALSMARAWPDEDQDPDERPQGPGGVPPRRAHRATPCSMP
eukprot:918589-Alexandrium_andersonii.AAC.1